MDGGVLDPLAAGIPIVSLQLERDGFRNGNLVIGASFALEGGEEDIGWAGIYLARVPVPEPGTLAPFGLGALALAGAARRRR